MNLRNYSSVSMSNLPTLVERVGGGVLVFFLLFFIGCNSPGSTDSQGITELAVSFSVDAEEMNVSEFAESVELVPLATADDLLLGEYSRIICMGELIYITDSKIIYRFDRNGELTGRISRQGEGPGDYIYMTDFKINSAGLVWVLDGARRRLYQYDWDGELVDEIALDGLVYGLYLENDSYIYLYYINVLTDENKHLLKRFSLETCTVTNEYLPIDAERAKYPRMIGNNHFSHTADGEGIYHFRMFSDTIYEIGKDAQLRPKYVMNIDGKNIPKAFFNDDYQNIGDFFQELYKHNYAFADGLYVESERYGLMNFNYGKRPHLAFIDRKTGASLRNFTHIKEDVNLFGYVIDISEKVIHAQYDNTITVLVNPYDVMDYARENLSEQDQKTLAGRLKYIGDDQNPVLLIIKLKQ
jgi:hypothetical protein